MNLMNMKFLKNAILGDRKDLFEKIWPVYLEFLESTDVTSKAEVYFLDKNELINDFYRWLSHSSHQEALALLDRRTGKDRRKDFRPTNPGRRTQDQQKAQDYLTSGKIPEGYQTTSDKPFLTKTGEPLDLDP